MPRKSSAAHRKADRTYRSRLVADGCCVRCGNPREPDVTGQRCKRCTAKAAEAEWRRRQRVPKAPRERVIRGWNYDTDDLITAHVKLAKALAWRMALKCDADVDDLIGDALYGLVVAGRTYDASYQVPFGAWASTRIKGEMRDGLRRWSKSWQKSPPQFVPFEEMAS